MESQPSVFQLESLLSAPSSWRQLLLPYEIQTFWGQLLVLLILYEVCVIYEETILPSLHSLSEQMLQWIYKSTSIKFFKHLQENLRVFFIYWLHCIHSHFSIIRMPSFNTLAVSASTEYELSPCLYVYPKNN